MMIRDYERVEIVEFLTRSEDFEHLLMAALIGFDRESKESLVAFENALAVDPGNPLTLWNFLDTCSRQKDAAVCAHCQIIRPGECRCGY